MTIEEYTRRAEALEAQAQRLICDIIDETSQVERDIYEQGCRTRGNSPKIPQSYRTGENRVLSRLIEAKNALRMSVIIAEEYTARFPEESTIRREIYDKNTEK